MISIYSSFLMNLLKKFLGAITAWRFFLWKFWDFFESLQIFHWKFVCCRKGKFYSKISFFVFLFFFFFQNEFYSFSKGMYIGFSNMNSMHFRKEGRIFLKWTLFILKWKVEFFKDEFYSILKGRWNFSKTNSIHFQKEGGVFLKWFLLILEKEIE